MTFLAVLIAYVLHRRYHLALSHYFDERLGRVLQRSDNAQPLTPHSGWIAVVLPTLIAVLLLSWLDQFFYGVITLTINLFVLVCCLGSAQLRPAVEAYAQAGKQGDWQGAWHYLEAAGLRLKPATESRESLNRQVALWYVQESFGLYFLVTFWFMLLGAPGALFARVVWIAQREGYAHWQSLAHLVYWLPVRLLVFSLGVVGNFMGMLRYAANSLIDPQADWREVLAQGLEGASLGVVGNPPSQMAPLYSARRLVNYAFLCWLVVLAVLTLAGALG